MTWRSGNSNSVGRWHQTESTCLRREQPSRGTCTDWRTGLTGTVKSRQIRSIIKMSLPLSIFVCLDSCAGILGWAKIPVTLKHVTWAKPHLRADFIYKDIVFNCEVHILVVSSEPSQQCNEPALSLTTGTSAYWQNMPLWESIYVWNKICRMLKSLWENFRKSYTDH